MTVSATRQLAATARNAAGGIVSGAKVQWTSSDPAVATVSGSGLATAMAAGTASIYATLNGRSGMAAITVRQTAVDHLLVTPLMASISVGAGQSFTATAYDANNVALSGQPVSWSSSNASVASVSLNGLASGIAAGAATVIATSDGRIGSAVLTVTAPRGPPGSCLLVTDANQRATSVFPKPAYLQPALEPDFRTTLVRVTGDPGTPTGAGLFGSWPNVAHHQYAKVQPWSADGKLLVLSTTSEAGPVPGAQLFLDGDTYLPLFWNSHPGPDARWHPTVPDVQVYVAANGSVGHWNARTGAATVKFATSNYTNANLGNYEGNLSNDGRYVAVNATRSSDGAPVVYVVDIDAGTKTLDLDIRTQGFASAADLDWTSVSQGGKYLVMYGRIGGIKQLTKVFDRATLAPIGFWNDHPLGHFDLGFDAAGNEVAFGAAAGGPFANRFLMRRLDNAQVTPLTGPISSDWHVSTRATQRPGWGLVVTNDSTSPALGREIFWVRLDDSPALQRLAHARTRAFDSQSAAIAAPSPDGRRVLFASNWDSANGRPVQTYVVDTRPLCP